jgi:Fe-S-cluster containining protein
MLDLLSAHGLIKENDTQIRLTVWHDCQHLQWDGEFASCAIYDDRPEFCSTFLCPRASGGVKIPEMRAVIE